MDLVLSDKIAIVTGSSQGLGLASARALVAEGCRVCLCARGADRLMKVTAELQAQARNSESVLAVQAGFEHGRRHRDRARPNGSDVRGPRHSRQ